MLISVLSFVGGKFNKLIRVWQERGAKGFYRFIYQRVAAKLRGRMTYRKWLRHHRLTQVDILSAQQEMTQWSQRPRFSVILPVYNVEERYLERAIESVINQIYPHWELCIADDCSTRPGIRPLLEAYATRDDRIKVTFRDTNGNIAAASNSALALATGDYIALLDHDDELAAHALFANARLINQHPDADFIYSDEDKINPEGQRRDPFFKPDWSPDYFHACMYTCHLGVYRTDLMRTIGGFRTGFDGSQDYDLVLRVVDHTKNIYHIPDVLYHWRIIPESVTAGAQAKPWAYDAAHRALTAMLDRSPYPGWVEKTAYPGFWRVRRHIVGHPLISIVIPSAGKEMATADGTICLLENCIRSIYQHSTYRQFEIVVVDGYDIPAPTLERLTQFADNAGLSLRLVRSAAPFNFAQRINQGVAKTTGEIVLLLNDDVEVTTPDWLESMLEFAQQDDIGAVGAKLLFADGRIQHCGVAVLGGCPGHVFYGADGNHAGYFCSNIVNRNYLVVTAACLMVKRAHFEQVGGMDEIFPINYNDVDFCLKLHQAGYRNVVTPFATLIHYESMSRQSGLRPHEWDVLNTKWEAYFDALKGDPYYNPNLSYQKANFEL